MYHIKYANLFFFALGCFTNDMKCFLKRNCLILTNCSTANDNILKGEAIEGILTI